MSLDQASKFNSEIKSLFTIPYLQLNVNGWENKKKKLLELMDKCDFGVNPLIRTSFFNEPINDSIELIFEEELGYMKKSFGFVDYHVEQSWFQEQTGNMFHPMHDHSGPNLMMSSICYIDFDPFTHTSTQFISPFVDSLSSSYNYFMPEVSEGTIIFFPSNIIHQSLPNISDKLRRIVSFNLNLKK